MNTNISLPILLILIATAAVTADAMDHEIDLSVDTTRVIGRIDEKVYGHFLEHIYHSCNGGLWGEIIWNRSFEEKQSKEMGHAEALRNPFRYWRLYGSGSLVSDSEKPLNSDVSARLSSAGDEAGLEQSSLYVHQDETYCGSVWVRGKAKGGLIVRLLDGRKKLAEVDLPAPSNRWREFPFEFKPCVVAENATLQIGVRGTGEVWLDQVSVVPESWRAGGGFRPDLLKAIADLRPPIIRWPGGSFVSTYQWKNGIGPQSQRRVAPKAMWDDRDVNSFGTDEYIAMCRKVGAQPLIVVNINAGGSDESRAEYIQSACDWVEYCNGSSTSKWGRVRSANGHPEPYHVVYWEIDNEVWKMKPADYAHWVTQFAGAMKRVDPSISIIACGSGQLGKRWNDGDRTVIEQCADTIDYLSVHVYENPDRFDAGIANAEQFIQSRIKYIAASKNPRLQLFFSEWNAQSTDWRTGLYAGGILNTFERSGVVGMATPALFLRHVSAKKWDNALINFNQKSWFPAPNYVVMKLYRDHYARDRVQITGDRGVLNVIATKSADGRRVVFKAVNPSEKPVLVTLKIDGGLHPGRWTLQLVAPDNLNARNTLDQPYAVHVAEGKIDGAGTRVRFTLPRWSVGVAEASQ